MKNSLIYKTTKTKGGKDYVITIKLADECKNGHNDFSITGEIYPVGKRGDRNMISGGAVGDEIAKAFPEFKLFNDLHLSDVNGAPTYATANGFYHLKETSIEVAAEYLRCSLPEAKYLYDNSEDVTVFTYMINKIGLPLLWKSQANEAIKQLEKLTGETFQDNSTTLQSVYLKKSVQADVIAKIKAGYYTKGELQKRKDQKITLEKKAKFDAIKKDLDQSIKKETDEYNVKFVVLSAGLDIDNFIYYNHTNEGHFNWLDYKKRVGKDEFNLFMEFLKETNLPLPTGITFKLK